MATSNLTPKRPWQLPRATTTEADDVIIVDRQGGTVRSVPIAGMAGALVGPPGANGTNGPTALPGLPALQARSARARAACFSRAARRR
jgi:hypothetical protein